jgi:hypothetical protein
MQKNSKQFFIFLDKILFFEKKKILNISTFFENYNRIEGVKVQR